MRCVICDASSNGLSTYRPDGHYHSKHFTEVNGDYYCDECSDSIEGVGSDWDIEDEVKENE